MRILLTAHRFWPHVGGTEEVVASLAACYARSGHDVTVFTSDEEGAPERETREGVEIRRFRQRRAGKFRVPPSAYRKAVTRGGWDLVHLHGQRVWSTDYLYPHVKRLEAPSVFTAHGFYQFHVEGVPVLNSLYYTTLLPRVLRHVSAVTALTGNEREELLMWGVPPGKVRVIPDGLDAEPFRALPAGFRLRHGITPGAPLLLYVGGFYRNKRVDRLVRAAAESGATLAVVGKDADPHHGLDTCRSLAERLGADVRFLGRLSREDVLSAYGESDLFVLGSEFEGFALVLLEAMAAGLPFVSTPAGAAPDLAAHGAGLVTGAESMGEAVKTLLADPRRRVEMGRAGRAAVESYSWKAIAERYLSLYEEVQRR